MRPNQLGILSFKHATTLFFVIYSQWKKALKNISWNYKKFEFQFWHSKLIAHIVWGSNLFGALWCFTAVT